MKHNHAAGLFNVLQVLGNLFLRSSLWMIEAALMLASSGIDGEYLASWMPLRLRWTGYALNTGMDAATALLMYWYGLLQRDKSAMKRKRSRWVLLAEAFSVIASWFFSWRQLRRVLPAIEPVDWEWVAFVSAMAIPLFLAVISFTQSLVAKIVDPEKLLSNASESAEVEQESISQMTRFSETPAQAVATLADWRELLPQLNGGRAELTANEVAKILEGAGYALPSARTLSNYARMARDSTRGDP